MAEPLDTEEFARWRTHAGAAAEAASILEAIDSTWKTLGGATP